MNKAELVDAVATAANLSKADAGRAVDAVMNSITKALKKGNRLRWSASARSVRRRAARSGRNPRTGETIKIAASKYPGSKLARPSRMP